MLCIHGLILAIFFLVYCNVHVLVFDLIILVFYSIFYLFGRVRLLDINMKIDENGLLKMDGSLHVEASL